MLVLSRKKDESIVLDGQIEITVLKIKGNTVRLGIKAPSNIKVLRGELSPFDVEVEVEKDQDALRGIGKARMIDMTNQDMTQPNPFAIAIANAS